jgi:hypothetical protein
MDKIYIRDANGHHLSFDLKDVLVAIGQPALETYWTAGPVERTGEMLDATGANRPLLEALVQSGERVDGHRLLELAQGIHQTIWGEFRGYETPTSPGPWIIVVAFDSTWFEVHTDNAAVLEALRARFKNTVPPTWSKAWVP